MVKNNKKNVQFVISHLEGCSGNFLGRLIASPKSTRELFRVDYDLNDHVLAINGRGDWETEIATKLISHTVVVTHNFNIDEIKHTFPSANLIQIYPYTHIGNVLYNVCHKKLSLKLDNKIDNYYLDIKIWHNRIKCQRPKVPCHDFWELASVKTLQKMLSIKRLSNDQLKYFNSYWGNQLQFDLSLPGSRMDIYELVKFWKIGGCFDCWMIAWVIYVYEYLNNLNESNRMWTIDDAIYFSDWTDVASIEKMYYVQ